MGTYVEEVMVDAPLYFWQFNETSGTTLANSGSRGSGGNGTINGSGTTLNVSGAPKGLKAISLSGSGEIAISTAEPDFSTNNTNFTYEGWAAFDSTQVTTYPTIIRRDGNAYATLLRGRGPGVGAVGPNLPEVYVNGANFYGTGVTVMDGVWRHYAMVKSGPVLSLYINGTLVNSSSGAANSTFIGGTMAFTVGGAGGATDERFKGQLAGIAVYSQALTQTRIQAHYNATAPSVTTFRGWGIPL